MKNNYMMIGLNLTNKNILFVGAGKIALRKVKKILEYQDVNVKVLALDFEDEFKDLDVEIIQDYYTKAYLKDIDLVFAATNNFELNKQIVEDASLFRILSNNSTSQKTMDFKMIAQFEYEDLTIGISSSENVSKSKQIKDKIEKILKEN